MASTPVPTPEPYRPAYRSPPIVDRFRKELIENDYCPECLGPLDEGWECNRCGYDALAEKYDGKRQGY